jgi:hypothetical protein
LANDEGRAVPTLALLSPFALAAVLAAGSAAPANPIVDPGFEAEGAAGALSTWTDCGTVPAKLENALVRSGRWAVTLGTTTGGEIAGDSSVCQHIVIPQARRVMLDYWAAASSSETGATHAYQEVGFYDGMAAPDKSKPYAVLVHDVANTRGFAHYMFDITPFAGETLFLAFGVHGDGYAGAHTSFTVDDVSIVVEGAFVPPT